MILVADESVDRQVIVALEGILEVYDVAAMNRGVNDEVVLSIARDQNAVLLTADKDFGELVFRQRKTHHGVVLTRLSGMLPNEKADLVVQVFRDHMDDLSDAFTVISARGVRIRHRI
jgi:predicted nuclease of predicted toxin-antitoxin system